MADWSSDEEAGGSADDAGADEHTERFYNEKYNDLVSQESPRTPHGPDRSGRSNRARSFVGPPSAGGVAFPESKVAQLRFRRSQKGREFPLAELSIEHDRRPIRFQYKVLEALEGGTKTITQAEKSAKTFMQHLGDMAR